MHFKPNILKFSILANFRPLKVFKPESFRALKLSNLEDFRALKLSNLATASTLALSRNKKIQSDHDNLLVMFLL